MKKKKVIAVVVALVVVVGGAAGGIFGYKAYQGKKLVAEVMPVSSISTGYWGDENYSSGMVTNDSSQEVYLSDTSTIQEIFVKEGDTVSIGDPLIAYDMAEVNLQVKQKELEISNIENEIALAKHNLEILKNTTPVDKTRPAAPTVEEPADVEPQVPETPVNPQVPERTETGAYNYVTVSSAPTNEAEAPDGSSDKPYRFLCSSSAYVTGNYLNTLIANGTMAVFEIRKDDQPAGEVIASWMFNGAYASSSFSDEANYYIMTHEEVVEEIVENDVGEISQSEVMEEWVEPEGYSAEELAEALADANAEIKTLDIQRRKAELELETLQKTSEDGTLYATVDGTVKTVGDPEEYVNDGTAFLVVTGSEGLYVTGAVSELLLDQVKVGTVVSANSWESGMSFEAKITEISDYPSTADSYYGEGNSNVSYYPYTAYIEDTTGLRNGEYLDLTITTGGGSSALYIEKAYVRTEDGKSYVMVANEDNKLEKRYVSTGKQIYGYAVEIKSGLSEEDRIAFPYGKNAVEGVSVTDAEETYYY